jgi:acetyl-CoA/propionyl-CoA carboxylase, biotin carboxylase, biotin carboxyl carrier protein
MFETVLVANRGEIALRVMRACRELGLRCVAIYSEADREACHVRYADDAYLIGPPPSNESYLNIDRIIETAHQSGAGSIHPGYGFLSENADFARAVASAGLTFIGPPPDATESLGGKVAARNLARQVDLPMVPGTLKPLADVEEARRIAEEFGYPIAIKAVGGGGGRGLRVVRSSSEIEAAFESARREASLSFKNDDLYVEKYLTNPRHIEIQILADTFGNVVYVGERDCSIQRRHQKLIEECPSPVLTPMQRADIGEKAVLLPQTVGYVGAGTLEFLYEDGNFYFLEMNSRIQVEHTVTEMVYGVDLVKAQIRIAQGEKLWFAQEDLIPRGHAIECRINAEDPRVNFRPALGTIGAYHEPVGLGVRVDSGVRANWEIPQYYDSLLAKLITWGQDRAEAIARMKRALTDYQIEGVTTTIPFYKVTMDHLDFQDAKEISVNFIPTHPELIERLSDVMPPAPQDIAAPAEPEEPMRTFTVEVNRRLFQVRVGEVGGPPRRGEKPAPRGRGKKAARSGAQSFMPTSGVISPIQGTVTTVRVEPGQEVESGQVLFIIEAMKMENEIAAPKAGKIGEIRAQPGKAIEAGAVLATFAE